MRDVALSVGRPLIASIIASACALAILKSAISGSSVWLIAILGGGMFAAAYVGVLLFAMKQHEFYLDIIRGLRRPPEEAPG